jgi:hypothetical protein
MMQTPRGLAPRSMAFHASERREEEAKPVAVPESKGGLLGSGLSEWFALPIGIAAAVPIIQFDWYVINEETQLAAVFIAFCVTLYTQAGDAIYKALDQNAQTLLKDHTEAEEKVIAALEEKLHFLKANQNMVNDFQAINALREKAYNNLNAAGVVKPKHDFKAQVERVLQMVAVEEANVTEKTKVALMSEATAAVTAEFTSSKALKKAALDSAIATIEGSTGKKEDPVQAAFVKFFKGKAAEAAKISGDAEEKAQREALITKINGVAKGEKFFFEFDDKGVPKMIV